MQPLLFLYDGLPTDVPKADAIHLLHKASILFIYTGWLLLPPRFLWVYLLYVGLTLVSWHLNADICPMTQAEYRARHWNPETTPGFTQLFVVRPFLANVGARGADIESTVTTVALNLIYVFFLVALVRVGLNYMTSK
jgi:hypothetical protein